MNDEQWNPDWSRAKDLSKKEPIDFMPPRKIENKEPFILVMPPVVSERMVTRMHLMSQIDLWDENNKEIAAAHARILIDVLKKQFDI